MTRRAEEDRGGLLQAGPGRSERGKAALTAGAALRRKESLIPFSLLLLYLFLEYGRPQDMLPFLRVLRLPGLTIGLLGLSILLTGHLRLGSRQTVLFLLMLGLMVVHGPIAVNNYWALMVFISMAMNFIVYLSLTQYVDRPEKYERLVNVWLGIHVFLALVGIVKRGRGIGGFLHDENDFCVVMNMIIPLSFFLAMNATGKKRLYFVALTCLYLFVIILTGSRGGFVGLCASSLYCWLRTDRKFVTGVIIGFFAMLAVLMAPQSYWDEVRSITEEGTRKGTGEERIYTWKVGWHMFLDNPVLGVGQGNFPYVFRKYEVAAGFGEEGYHGRSVAGRAAHSIYFTMLPELGLVGTGIFLAMVAGMLKDLRSIRKRSGARQSATGPPMATKVAGLPKRRPSDPMTDKYVALALAMEGALVSFLVSGGFISILYYPNVWVLMGFIVSLKNVADHDAGRAST